MTTARCAFRSARCARRPHTETRTGLVLDSSLGVRVFGTDGLGGHVSTERGGTSLTGHVEAAKGCRGAASAWVHPNEILLVLTGYAGVERVEVGLEVVVAGFHPREGLVQDAHLARLAAAALRVQVLEHVPRTPHVAEVLLHAPATRREERRGSVCVCLCA